MRSKKYFSYFAVYLNIINKAFETVEGFFAITPKMSIFDTVKI